MSHALFEHQKSLNISRDNQKPQFEEEQTIQWPIEREQDDKSGWQNTRLSISMGKVKLWNARDSDWIEAFLYDKCGRSWQLLGVSVFIFTLLGMSNTIGFYEYPMLLKISYNVLQIVCVLRNVKNYALRIV